MRIALAQIDPIVGDFPGNRNKICAFIEKARQLGSDMVVFPELALIGYPPRDLLEKKGFVERSYEYLEAIKKASERIAVLLGSVVHNESAVGKPFHNAALFFNNGCLETIVHKRLLPSYDVFDEERYFEPGTKSGWIDFMGTRIGITICEDIWTTDGFFQRPLYKCDPVQELAKNSIQILINISASPYNVGKIRRVAKHILQRHVKRYRFQLIYVNQVGGNDELIFQGHSMVWDETGQLVTSCADFEEDLVVYDTVNKTGALHHNPGWSDPEEIIAALTLGLRDYAHKCGFKKGIIGLSGGIDSAVTACLAVLALGRENVRAVAMPGPYSSLESLEDAQELAQRLGISLKIVPISALFKTALETLAPVFTGLPADVTEENLQARLRGLILMALSNKFNWLLLNTGNKSELAVGYCTLYGDMNGGLSVLGDVPKTMVYEMAKAINDSHDWIPERILTKPPSAELRPQQKDEDTLPPYPVLDPILAAYIEERLSYDDIVARGFDPDTVRWVINRVDRNEYKRWQAPPVLKVTTKAFGIGWRFPIAHGYRNGIATHCKEKEK